MRCSPPVIDGGVRWTAGFDGRLGTVLPGAEDIHRIKLNSLDPQRYLTDLRIRLVER